MTFVCSRTIVTSVLLLAVAALELLCYGAAFAPRSQLQRFGTQRGSSYNSATALLARKKRRKNSNENDNDRDRILNNLVAKDNSKMREGASFDDQSTTGEPTTRTLSGGPSLIFEMARRMLVWDDELYQGLNDASRDGEEDKLLSTAISNNNVSTNAPRWRPSSLLQRSISNVNPAFRTSSPIMTSAGYAGILRRNSRKKMKPSMWRHTLRVYDKMADLEKITIDGEAKSKKKAIRRKTIHHEAALVAASKLAMWEEAIKIFRSVEEMPQTQIKRAEKAVVGIGDGSIATTFNGTDDDVQTTMITKTASTTVTDNMILSVISACVKGSKVRRIASVISPPVTNTTDSINATSVSVPRRIQRGPMRLLTIEERRRPLDQARDIILSMEVSGDLSFLSICIELCINFTLFARYAYTGKARHTTCCASYQSIGSGLYSSGPAF